jgi:hypothetical protein
MACHIVTGRVVLEFCLVGAEMLVKSGLEFWDLILLSLGPSPRTSNAFPNTPYMQSLILPFQITNACAT